jgi:hypothetical protein
VLHRTIEYNVQEIEPGLWRWTIYPGNRTVQGPVKFRTRELAVESCQGEINNGIERTRRQYRWPPHRNKQHMARAAEAEQDELKMRPLVHQALSWIYLAENEELLAEGALVRATVLVFPPQT